MNAQKQGIALLLLAGGIGLSGCAANTSSLQIEGNTRGENVVTAYKLGKHLEVLQIKGEFINGLYRGRVTIANKKDSTQGLQYRFTWYDSAGQEVGIDGNGWTPFVLNGKDEKSLVGLAPNAEANGFRINVRDLKANKTFKTNLFGII
jgi:uncharacterized protein YcfL